MRTTLTLHSPADLSSAARTRLALLAGQLLIRNREGDAERRRWKLTVGDPVGNNLNGKAFRIADRLISGVAVTHYAWQLDRLRDPTPVFLPIKLDRQFHPFIICPRQNSRRELNRSRHSRVNPPSRRNNIRCPAHENAIRPW
jgi:hypothetical protein